MNEFERRLRAAVRAEATNASDARAPRSVRRSIGRRRALLPGALGVTGALVISSLATGGLGLAEPTEPPTPSPTPDLSIDQGPRGYAEVPLPDDSYEQMLMPEPGRELCNMAAPEPALGADDFTAAFDAPERLELGRHMNVTDGIDSRASVSLTYHADDELPVFAGQITALVIQDNVVVGYTDNFVQETVSTFSPDQMRTFPWHWNGWLASCTDEHARSTLPAGDYEVVFVGRVHNSLARAAQWSLELGGYMLPAAADLEAFREGSYLCERWSTRFSHEPLTCRSHAVVGFELDAHAGTATIPYDTSLYSRDVDVTFVSKPVPATLGEDLQDYSFEPDLPTYEPGMEPLCGDVYADIGDTGAVIGHWPEPLTAFTPGETLATATWLWNTGWSNAKLEMPQDPRVWLLTFKEIDVSIQDDVMSTYFGHELVGWIDTESTESVVELSAYDGPADWPLTVTKVQWCDGQEPTTGVTGEGPHALLGLIAAPATATLDDRPSQTTGALVLHAAVRY